jgi:hypothetical protein
MDQRTRVDRMLDAIKNNRIAAVIVILCIGLAALANLTDTLKKLAPLLPGPAKLALDGEWRSEPFDSGSPNPQTLGLRVKEIAEGRLAGTLRFYDVEGKALSPEFDVLEGKRTSNHVAFSFDGGLKRAGASGAPLVPVAQSFSGELSDTGLRLVYEREGYTPVAIVAHKLTP